MLDFVYECYSEFKKFMDLTDNFLPEIQPVIQKNVIDEKGKIPIAYINADEILMNPVNLYISSFLFDYEKKFQRSKLFHEFTHILDAVTLFKDFPYEKLIALLSTYSEYHASQIELARNIGFKNIHSYRKINLDKTYVTYENNSRRITTDYLQPMADALCIIEKNPNEYFGLSMFEYYHNYSVFEAKTIYYLGKRKLCEILSLNKIADITDDSYGKFAPYIRNIEKCIERKDFDSLITTRNELWCKYKSYFVFENSNILPKEP